MAKKEAAPSADEVPRLARQQWLIEYKNPLGDRLGKDFFRSIPREPGVYFFHGEDGTLLYVGKAKDLRARITSYRRAHPDTDARKTLQLVYFAHKIRWEILPDEKAALLREAELLQALKPPYNVMGTDPESYFLVGIGEEQNRLHLRLTTSPHLDPHELLGPEYKRIPRERLYGAFRARGATRDAYGSLLRLLWTAAADTPETRFDFPGRLVRPVPPYQYSIQTVDPAADWTPMVRELFTGRSSRILTRLTEALLGKESIPPFYYRLLQEDLERVRDFYLQYARRSAALRKHANAQGAGLRGLIPQDHLDALIIEAAQLRPARESPSSSRSSSYESAE